jgi:hypothetical protein
VIELKLKKLSFIFILFAFLVFSAINVSADITTRSLPTIYKVTGDIDMPSPGTNYYFLVTSVKNGTTLYPVSKTQCAQYSVLKDQLTQGMFIGPISSEVTGYNNKSFTLRLMIQKYSSQSLCQTGNNSISMTGNIGELYS